jgi:ketosteroid isomerase-like protein
LDDIEAVKNGERQLAKAHLTLDLEKLDSLFHPDYFILQPDGIIETKAEVLDSYASGARQWDSAQVDEMSVRIHQDTAIVTGHWRATGKNEGTDFDYAARFLSVWIKEAGKWRNIAYQSVEIDL